MGINFLEEDAPDATTLLEFRRLLEQHGLNKLFFDAINRVMVATGHMLKGGTVVDATIINACALCLRQSLCIGQSGANPCCCLVRA